MWRPRTHVVLAALVPTLANAAKPLVIDDTAYTLYARQILADPADPYGFEILWPSLSEEGPLPALRVLAPPLLPYWLAGSMALFGDDPVRWKLALFPFALALAASLWRLAARFAPGLEAPVLWMAVLSPSVLPFFNLMLDLPSLSLALLALVIFFAACDRGRPAGAALAGLLVGLSMQTKYTGATALAAMLAYGAIFARFRGALLAAAVGLGLFCGWEALMALRYGESHLLAVLHQLPPLGYYGPLGSLVLWSAGLVLLIGALAPAVGLLGGVALGLGPRAVGAAALAVASGFAALPFAPAVEFPAIEWTPPVADPTAEELLFAALGLPTAASLLAVAARTWRRGTREDRFLAAWLAIEVLGYAALSPYLAARRLLGVVPVALLLCARAALQALGAGSARKRLRVPLALGVALALLFTASELADAAAGPAAVRLAERRLRELGAEPARESIWYVGHWGFQFYAERAGMRAVEPGRSQLREGDWLLLPQGFDLQGIGLAGAPVPLDRIDLRSASPWATNPWSYGGPVPMRPRADAIVRVWIHRVHRDFVPPAVPPGDTRGE